ncbi:MAG: RNA ligase family protein [Prolixibacteraceae bacterium]
MQISLSHIVSRDNFREGVFARDNHKCVICGKPAQDAHHILERRLFDNGGYYLNNGASLCSKHHIEAETTELDAQVIRDAAGITTIVLPEHLYTEFKYDKWGNIMNPNGTRVQGELFYQETVQKILKQGNMLGLFSKYVKYPRTYHFPFSQPNRKDDKYWSTDYYKHFEDKRVICTIKMDGENTSMYPDHVHARSLNSEMDDTRKKVKDIWSRIAWEIPEDWRLCGENLYARHTIPYDNLESYFYMFSIWYGNNICMSWDEMCEWADILNIATVPVLYDGIFDANIVEDLPNDPRLKGQEGFTMRIADEFPYASFRNSLVKYVSPDFVVPHGHWRRNKIVPNNLNPNTTKY